MGRVDPVVICFPGAVCAVGTTLAQIASATNAGVRRLIADERLCFRANGTPVHFGRVAAVDEIDAPIERMVQLARHAMWQSLFAAGIVVQDFGSSLFAGMPMPVLLSVPPPRPGLSIEMVDTLVTTVMAELLWADTSRSGAVRTGHDGFTTILEVAVDLIERREVHACLLGAVDCGVDADYVVWLESLGRLRSRQQPHGMAPGEAAGFCFVTRQSTLGSIGSAGIEVLSATRGQESNPWYTQRATTGDGLTTAVRHALDGQQVDLCYADLNGESWRSAEWDFAYLRNGRQFGHPLDIRHPIEAWGDIGAASGALLTLLAAWDLQEGLLGHRSALVCTSSDTQPTRAAARLGLITES